MPRFCLSLVLVPLLGCPEVSQLGAQLQPPPGQARDAQVALPSPAAAEPLRDPREWRLREVRQLTHGSVVAFPRFSSDGTAAFLARTGKDIAAETIGLLPDAGAQPLRLTTPERPPERPWSLVTGFGGLCLAAAAPSCSLEGWPGQGAPSPCQAFTEGPLFAKGAKTSDAPACPHQPPNALPCVARGGASACPVPCDHGLCIALTGKGGGPPLMLGSHDDLSFDPAFSADGERLVFVRKSKKVMRLWVAPVAHPEQAAAVGPEAGLILDPTFTASNDELLFASTVDDAAGRELDLDLLSLATGALERVTFSAGVDRFPQLDGDSLLWVSERNADPGTLDLYQAHWQRDSTLQRK